MGSSACQITLKGEKKSVLGDLPVVMQAVSGRAGNAAWVARVVHIAQHQHKVSSFSFPAIISPQCCAATIVVLGC